MEYSMIAVESQNVAETADITAVITKSPSPSYAVEGQNFTLEWTYTLDGSVGSAKVAVVNSDGTELLIGKKFDLGVITVEPNYQPRFRAQATDTTAKLTILAVQRSDAGTYRLNVLPTGLGSIFVTVILDVSFPPSITEISGNQTVTEGGNVTLMCLADGKPTPNITWTRLSDNRVVNTTLTDIIKQDAGSYKCTADNGIGNPAIADVRIVVQYPVEAKGFGKNETLIQGDRKTLSCPVHGSPKPNITWYRSSEVIGRPIFVGEKLEVRGTGCYTCVASNSLGTPINITQCLKFESFTGSTTPSRAQDPVEAKGFVKNETLIQGDRKTLSCPVQVIPKPNITWYRGSEVIGRPIFVGEKLEVRGTGCYTCVASNSLGMPINITQCLKFESFTGSTTPSRAQGGPPWIVIGIVAGFTVFVANCD
ncbi:opioid-binding protein/cell adhesion molecule-like isoform X2 [Acropora muricata]|uniref:opioid-binding protein/cell adhesion molecule-like isoform X2 n=1 Tax=Acropora muricata TaxID=159855 RepID=UPI0034E492DE